MIAVKKNFNFCFKLFVLRFTAVKGHFKGGRTNLAHNIRNGGNAHINAGVTLAQKPYRIIFNHSKSSGSFLLLFFLIYGIIIRSFAHFSFYKKTLRKNLPACIKHLFFRARQFLKPQDNLNSSCTTKKKHRKRVLLIS